MLASKYADAPSTSPPSTSRRTSSAADGKPLPPLPMTSNGATPEHTKSASASNSHSRHASREQKQQSNGSPITPRFRRSTQNGSTSEAKIEEAVKTTEVEANAIPPATTHANLVPTTATGAPDVPMPDPPVAASQSRDAAATPEPPRAQPAAPLAKIPAKKMTSKKGRPCVIRIPADTITASVRHKPLSTVDIQERLKTFESEGYNVRGYDHDVTGGKEPDDGLDAPSRRLFHASQTSQSLATDANPGKPVIAIPDRKVWDQYRNDLVEAKLRALGVLTAPDPEPEPEPEEMDMSMQDPHMDPNMFPGMATSPPPLSSSVNSHHQWHGPAPFSAPFSPAAFTNNTSIGGVGSPVSSMGGPQMVRPGHLSRQSTFNFSFPQAFNPALQQQFSPQPGAGGPLGFHRGASPSLAGNAIPRLSSALSRNSPDPYADQRQQTPRLQNAGLPNSALQNMGYQMPPIQPPAKNPRRMTLMNSAQNSLPGSTDMTPQGSSQGFNNDSVTPPPNNGRSDSYTDLAYPTPRHRSNISQNLEREAEKPQYYPGEYVDNENEEAEINGATPGPKPIKDSIDISKTHFGKASHTSTGSTSRFNVEAKEFKFDPKAAHHRQISSTKNPFMPERPPLNSSKPTVSFITAHANGETTGETDYDARASSFKPPTQSDFSFGSTLPFDFSKTAEPKAEPEKRADETKTEGDGEKKSKIFSGISLADFVKPAKKSKAIPIVNPNAMPKNEDPPAPQPVEAAEDESGRITQDISRHKRGKTAAPGGDDVPRFATPSSPGLTPQPESVKSKSPAPVPEPQAKEKQQAKKPAIDEKAAEKPTERTTEAVKDAGKEDEDAGRWSDFGIEPPKTPPRRAAEKSAPLVDVRQTNDSMDTTVPRSVVSDATQAAQRSHWQSLLDSSPPRLPSPSRLPRFPDGDLDPDFAEIDAIMEHLNDQPQHGAEEEEERRAASPQKAASIVNERLGGPTPELREPEEDRPTRLTAPSFGHEASRSRSRDVSVTPAEWVREQRPFRESASPVRKLNTTKEAEVSDWDEMISDKEATKFLPQAQFFDTRVKSLIEGILQQHLSPLQRALKDVDKTVKSMPGREPREAWPLTDRADKTESDADDEDNADETDIQRSRSVRSDKKLDKIRSIVQEAVASQQSTESSTKRELDSLRSTLLEAISSSRPAPPVLENLSTKGELETLRSSLLDAISTSKSSPPALDNLDTKRELESLRSTLLEAISTSKPSPAPIAAPLDVSEIRNVVQEIVNAKSAAPDTPVNPHLDSHEIRAIIEEVVGAKQDTTIRLEDEMRLRNDAERKADDLQRLLDLSEKEVVLYRESSENTERQIQSFRDDRVTSQNRVVDLEKVERELRARTSGLTAEVSALQGTLEEYRTSSTRWRNEIDSVKKAREGLQHNIEDVRQELHHTKQTRDNMSVKLERLQEALSTTSSNLQKERENFRARDEQLSKEGAVMGSRLEEEFRIRQRLERELDRQNVHERNAVKANVTVEELRNTNQRLMAEVTKLRQENTNERNSAQMNAREASEAKDIARAEIMRNKTLLEAEIEVSNMRTESTRTDLETRLDHVRGELSAARHENAKIRQEHKKNLDEAHVQRTKAVREASESANNARGEERKHFERLTAELSKQHDDAMKRAIDERQRVEVHFNETLHIANEKNALLGDKVHHLEDKVHVAQSAARAAAEAAQNQTALKAKEAAAQREHLRPSERVSPQALRESIVVLQEQLQQREGRIETLESELDAVDKQLPSKYKDRETEISWLRELLNVRLDDISELVNLLSLDNYDHIAARDAAIRIKANLQMEQQEKERLIGRQSSSSSSAPRTAQNNPLPSLNDIQNFATPRAAQLAAAWGNWRKSGQSPSLASLRGVVSGQPTASREPMSKPPAMDFSSMNVADNPSSAQSFLSGLMTPPASNLRRTPTPQSRESRGRREREDEEMSNMSDAQPLSLAAELGEDDGDSVTNGSPSKMMSGGRGPRPRTPQGASVQEDAPVTPPPVRSGSNDLDAELSLAEADNDDGEEEEEDTVAEVAQDAKLPPLEA